MNNVRLWKKLFSRVHLNEHFQEKVKRKSSVGLDKITVSKFEKNIDDEIEIINRKVLNGTYHFTRYKQVLFSKGEENYPRVISIPTVRDKLVSSVLNELLSEIFGSQSKVSLPHVIIANIQKDIAQYNQFIKIDISSFYSSIDHKKLMRFIRRKIRKKEILSLIENSIKTETISLPMKKPGKKSIRKKGIPEGLPISNALANIYLSKIDEKYSADDRIKYFRYVDDILILVNSENFHEIYKSIKKDLHKLSLKTNKKEETGNTENSFSYLGYQICNTSITVRKISIYRLENAIEDLIKLTRNNQKLLEWKLNLKITGFIIERNKYGWMFFYSQITDTSILHHFDWYVNKLLVRYNLDERIKVKKFVRTFYEITMKLHRTKYIPNIDDFDLNKKKNILINIYGEKIDKNDDAEIEFRFSKIMKKEIQDSLQDIEHFS